MAYCSNVCVEFLAFIRLPWACDGGMHCPLNCQHDPNQWFDKNLQFQVYPNSTASYSMHDITDHS